LCGSKARQPRRRASTGHYSARHQPAGPRWTRGPRRTQDRRSTAPDPSGHADEFGATTGHLRVVPKPRKLLHLQATRPRRTEQGLGKPGELLVCGCATPERSSDYVTSTSTKPAVSMASSSATSRAGLLTTRSFVEARNARSGTVVPPPLSNTARLSSEGNRLNTCESVAAPSMSGIIRSQRTTSTLPSMSSRIFSAAAPPVAVQTS